MSWFSDLVPFGAVMRTFLCLNCHLLVKIQEIVSGLCLSSDLFELLDDLYHRTDALPRAFPGNGEQSRCYLVATYFGNLSWGSLIKVSCTSELAMPLCNMRSLRIADGVRLYIEILGNGKIMVVSNWLRPTRVLNLSYHSMTCVPQSWRAELCLSGNYSKLSKCVLEKASVGCFDD